MADTTTPGMQRYNSKLDVNGKGECVTGAASLAGSADELGARHLSCIHQMNRVNSRSGRPGRCPEIPEMS